MCSSQHATISAISSFVIMALRFDAKVMAIAGPFYTSFIGCLPISLNKTFDLLDQIEELKRG